MMIYITRLYLLFSIPGCKVKGKAMPVPDKSEVRMIDEIVLKVFMEGWYTCLAHGRNNLYQPMGNLVKALYGGNTRH